jgi:glyoxylase-like metal-dependent hydrolase (beta-lactamase superfamily II)
MPDYEIFALKYGTHDRPASANFIGGDFHDSSMPLDYYVWLIRNGSRLILVDVGFGAEAAVRRGRTLLRTPVDALALLDVRPEQIDDIVITHLHFDHAGCLDAFPNARFHLQDREMAYATGRNMRHPFLRFSYDLENVTDMVKHVYADRVVFHDGESGLAEGVTLHPADGHTMGLQAVCVTTRRGPVVLASDAFHLYMNLSTGRPFPIVHDVGAMMESWQRLLALAGDMRHLVPGHDPLVAKLFPAPAPELEGIVSMLHEEPAFHEILK